MTVVYFDSSAFVKLLVNSLAVSWPRSCGTGASRGVQQIGIPRGARCAGRGGSSRSLEASGAPSRRHCLGGVLGGVRAVELTDSVAVHAGDLAGRFSLRGADAVHLASLLAIGADDILFAVWDQRLRAGASAAGVNVVPESP